jgi:hypothetical protein
MSKKAKAAKAKPKRKVKKGPAKKMTGSAAQRNKDDRTTPRPTTLRHQSANVFGTEKPAASCCRYQNWLTPGRSGRICGQSWWP